MEVVFMVGNLTKQEVDAIVNPANSECEMGGGVAGAIKRAGGKSIEREAMEMAPVAIGQAVLTSAGRLPCKFVVHAPTMKMPVQRTNVENISKAVLAALHTASEDELRSLAFPGMGTGTGRVPQAEAAAAMLDAVRAFPAAESQLERLVFVDRNKEMVAAWQDYWNRDETEREEEEA